MKLTRQSAPYVLVAVWAFSLATWVVACAHRQAAPAFPTYGITEMSACDAGTVVEASDDVRSLFAFRQPSGTTGMVIHDDHTLDVDASLFFGPAPTDPLLEAIAHPPIIEIRTVADPSNTIDLYVRDRRLHVRGDGWSAALPTTCTGTTVDTCRTDPAQARKWAQR